jgi:hypothetical protein
MKRKITLFDLPEKLFPAHLDVSQDRGGSRGQRRVQAGRAHIRHSSRPVWKDLGQGLSNGEGLQHEGVGGCLQSEAATMVAMQLYLQVPAPVECFMVELLQAGVNELLDGTLEGSLPLYLAGSSLLRSTERPFALEAIGLIGLGLTSAGFSYKTQNLCSRR